MSSDTMEFHCPICNLYPRSPSFAHERALRQHLFSPFHNLANAPNQVIEAMKLSKLLGLLIQQRKGHTFRVTTMILHPIYYDKNTYDENAQRKSQLQYIKEERDKIKASNEKDAPHRPLVRLTFCKENLGLKLWYDEREEWMRVVKVYPYSEVVTVHDMKQEIRGAILKEINGEVIYNSCSRGSRGEDDIRNLLRLESRPITIGFETLLQQADNSSEDTKRNYQVSITLLLQQTQKYSSGKILAGPLGTYVDRISATTQLSEDSKYEMNDIDGDDDDCSDEATRNGDDNIAADYNKNDDEDASTIKQLQKDIVSISHTFLKRDLGLKLWYDKEEKAMRVIKISQKSELTEAKKQDIIRHMILYQINETKVYFTNGNLEKGEIMKILSEAPRPVTLTFGMDAQYTTSAFYKQQKRQMKLQRKQNKNKRKHGSSTKIKEEWVTAIRAGDLDKVKKLIPPLKRSSETASVNLDDNDRYDTTDWIIDHNGSNPLHWAAGSNHLHICSYLVHTCHYPVDGCIVVGHAGGGGRQPIHWAARNGHLSVCQWLVGQGANVYARTDDGTTVFHWSCWQGHTDVISWSIRVGGPEIALLRNDYGCNAAHFLALQGDVRTLQLLVEEFGLDVCSYNHQGHNPIHKAAWRGHVDICDYLYKLLVVHAAKNLDDDAPIKQQLRDHFFRPDVFGWSPCDIARLAGHDHVVEWFLETFEEESI